MQKKYFQLLFLSLAVISLTLSPLSTVASYNKPSALTYLQTHPSFPWSILGRTALGDSNISDEALKNISSSSAIELETPILALAALGKDPKNYNGQNYIEKLKAFVRSDQLGDATILNDDIFGILAFKSAGLDNSEQAIQISKNFLLANQNSDGGWAFAKGSPSDSNTTASAIVALASVGSTATDTNIQDALNFLKSAQNDDGGFTYDPHSPYGTDSDSSSTSWVIWALNALSLNQSAWSKSGNTPSSFLEANQDTTGFFKFQTGSEEDSFSPITTAYASIALSGKSLPIFSDSRPATTPSFNFRIEGSAEQVCEGKAQGPTALNIIENASIACGFTFHIKQASFGKYLDNINNDTAFGQTGWMYLVNNTSPDVGAADYNLKTGDEVLWYFGDFGWKPTRLSFANNKVPTGQQAQAKTEYYNNGSWQTLSTANINYGVFSATTDNNGSAQLDAPDGYYKVSASKSGYIRSNQILMQVGDPASSAVNLSANLIVGEVQGTSTRPSAISFTVDATNLAFGDIQPGSSASKAITINNNGTVGLKLEGSVAGDRIFLDNLSINGKTWQKFVTNISLGQSQSQNLKLSIPSGYDGSSGIKTGQLIFWAAAAN